MIRFTPEFDKEITRIVNKFNAKISRLQAQNATHLPKIVDESELRAKYVNRNLLKRELQQMEEFSRPGAEEIVTSRAGIKKTKWEWNKLEKDRVYALKKVTRSLNKEKYSRDSDTISSLRAHQNFLRTQAIRGKLAGNKRELIRNKGREELDLRHLASVNMNILTEEVREYQFKENMLKMITNAFSQAGMDADIIGNIKDQIDRLSPRQLLELYNDNTIIKDFVEGYAAYTQFDFTAKNENGNVSMVSTIDVMAEMGTQFQENITKLVEEKLSE